MKSVKIISLLSILIFISSIAIFAQEKVAIPANTQIQKVSDQTSNQRTAYVAANDRYRIGYQDTVEVTVFKHSELSLTVKVNPDGTIFLPRLNAPIVAVCKTENELKDIITESYKKNYLREPFVSVRVSSQSQSFGVVGAVQKPGTFYLDRKIRLLELLTLAGGQDVEFAGGKIQLARLGSVTGCQENLPVISKDDEATIQSFNMRDVLEGKQNPWMQPGDIISVSQAEEAYVIGNVNKPTTILLREPVTLTTAIAKAEGTDKNAKTDKVIIQRQEKGSNVKTELEFNLKDIRDKKIADPVLQANDVVAVGTDKFKSFGNGLMKAVTGALPNAVYRIP